MVDDVFAGLLIACEKQVAETCFVDIIIPMFELDNHLWFCAHAYKTFNRRIINDGVTIRFQTLPIDFITSFL